MAEGYSDIPHTTYAIWKQNTIGHEYDLDGSYGCQCLTAGHKVLMNDATLKDVSKIKVGEKVSTGNTVISNKKRKAEVYKVYTSVGNFHVSKDHRFILSNGEECYVKDCLHQELKLDLKEKKSFNLTNNELRFLGFYLGDGTKQYRHKNSTMPHIFVTVGTKDKEDYLLSLNITYHLRMHSNKKAKIFSIINKEHPILAKLIHEVDGKKLPLSFTKTQYKYIIEGYIHADGSKKRAQYVCSSIDKELLLSIQHGCFLNNWQAKLSDPIVRNKTNFCNNPKPIYRLSINPNKQPKAKVRKIEYTGTDYVYVLNLDGNHLYYADNVEHHNCWDYASLFWRNVGFPAGYPLTGNLSYAYQCWTASRVQNAGDQFDLIYNVSDIKQGDVIVMNGTSANPPGHITFADEDYNGTNTIWCVGQNQGGTPLPGGGTAVTRDQLGLGDFLGAFRYKAWHTTPPITIKRTVTRQHFPWAIYARKLRNR